MKNIIAAFLFAWCCNSLANDLPDLGEPTLGRYELSTGQVVAEIGFVGLMYADYRQTMESRERHCRTPATYNPDGTIATPASSGSDCSRHETNPLLGPKPSEARIRNYFVGATLIHIAVAKALPTEYRPYWIGAGILVEIVTVVKNRKLGYSVSF